MVANMFLQARNLVFLISVGSTLSALLPAQETQKLYATDTFVLPALRIKRTTIPTRAIMYSSYFSAPRGYRYNPPFQARNYEPQGAMTAFAAGNSVSTRSYYGNEYQPSNVQPNCGTCLPNGQDIPQGQPDSTGVTLPPYDAVSQPEPPVTILSDPALPEAPADIPEENPESVPNLPNGAPVVPDVQETPIAPEKTDVDEPNGNGKESETGKNHPSGNGNGHTNGDGNANGNGRTNGNGGTKSDRAPKAPPKKPDDEYEYDDEEEQPFIPGKRRGPGKNYNSYFPIYFGLPGYGSRGQGEGGPLNPGVATAIANSYSNGKGAVATSHATAYGGPNFGNGSKKGPKGRPTSQ